MRIISKKGIAFYLNPLVLAIIFAFIFITYISPLKAQIETGEISDTIKNTDLILQQKVSQNSYLYSILESSVFNSKDKFMKSYFNSKGIFPCIENKSLILYDDRKTKTCPNEFEDISNSYQNFLLEQIQNNLALEKKIGIDKSELSSNYDSDYLNLKIKISSEKQTNISKISSSLEATKKVKVSAYFNFLNSISEIILELKEIQSKNLRKCEKSFQKEIILDKSICQKKLTQDYFKSKSKLNNYRFEIESFEIEDKNYYGLKINIIEKISNVKILDFIVIFSLPPLDYPSFTLEQFEYANNVLQLSINKQGSENVNNYIVLYSYENFFDKTSNKRYLELLDEFSKGGIPESVTASGFSDEAGSIKYYYSKPEFNLNLLSVSKKDGTDIQKIKLYQSYNFKKNDKSYLKLENKQIYVFVFAVNSKQSYLLDESKLKNAVKSKIPVFKFGPKSLQFDLDPTTIDNFIVNENLFALQNSIEFQIQGYEDKRATAYEIYITKDQVIDLAPKCQNSINFCSYITIPVSNLNSSSSLNSFKYLISSDSNFPDSIKNTYTRIIGTSEFSKAFILENGIDYSLYVIPIDSSGLGIYKLLRKEFNVIKEGEKFNLVKDFINIQKPAKKNFKVLDKKNPNPLSTITITPQISKEGILTFRDNSQDLEEIISLKMKREETQETILVSIQTGQIPNFDSTQSYTFNKIFPVDSSGNFYTESTFITNTNHAFYTP